MKGLFHLPLFVSVGDLWTCFASLFLYVMIKYCLSAQLIPEAKGKSLCPHIICKLSLSQRTDLFTGRESVLYYPAVTLPCLSSLFSVMPSHSCCSVWGLHISFLGGGGGEKKGGIKTYLSGNHNLLRGKAFIHMLQERLGGEKANGFEAIKFNTDHSLTPNIFKDDFDRRCKATLLDLAAWYHIQVTARP